MDLSTWHGMRTRDPRRLALGSAQWDAPLDRSEAIGSSTTQEIAAVLARARTAGVRTIETARAYGTSEAQIGRATADQEGWRILTKLSPDVHRDGLDIAETLERVDRSLDESQRALGLDALPVLMLHRFGHRHACGGRLWRKLLAERESGRIGALGVAAATPEEAWAALEDPDIEVLEVASSLLDLRLHRQGFFPRARELGRTVHVHSVFLEGVALLEPGRLPPFLIDLVAPLLAIRSSADRLGVTVRALHLAFVQNLPGACPIIPCESDSQFAGLLADWASEAVDAASLGQLVDSLPTLDSAVIDPSRWPTSESIEGAPANQPGAQSVATMPA
jgi:aryl-alcohol dehydrogenase-like predicted oxidoreductase